MSAEGEICGIYKSRVNADGLHQYQVKRTKRTKLKWEFMDAILDIDAQFPMKQYVSNHVIEEYHEYILDFAQETAKYDKSTAKKQDPLIFRPIFDVECILEEKQESDDDEIQYKIRWKGWPKEYDSWTFDTLCPSLIEQFRRSKRTKNLGTKGFTSSYWKQLYSSEWEQYMDGMHNGAEHSDYVYYFFKKYGIHQQIEHIADYGFGHGNMLEAFVKKFKPKVVYGLEPSSFAFEAYTAKFMDRWKTNNAYFNKCHVSFECIDLMEYFKRESLDTKQVEIYNKKYQQRMKQNTNAKNQAMDVDDDDADDDDVNNDKTLKEILNNKKYEQFCYCSRSIKNKKYYQRKEEKLHSSKRAKSKIKSADLRMKAYNDYNCSCGARFNGVYELGICVSVFQYLNDEDVEIALCQLSKQCDFLYFDVVTAEEYDMMSNGSTFQDKWAISRPRKWYLERIFKYWRIIGNEILESKFFYPDNKSSNVPNNIYVFNGL